MPLPIHDFLMRDVKFENGRDPNGKPGPWVMSSVTVTEEEFQNLISEDILRLDGTALPSNVLMSQDEVNQLRLNRHIQMIVRTPKTQQIFNRYGSKNDFMSVVVAGHRYELAHTIFKVQTMARA
jgi:hypothetical protein